MIVATSNRISERWKDFVEVSRIRSAGVVYIAKIAETAEEIKRKYAASTPSTPA